MYDKLVIGKQARRIDTMARLIPPHMRPVALYQYEMCGTKEQREEDPKWQVFPESFQLRRCLQIGDDENNSSTPKLYAMNYIVYFGYRTIFRII